MDKTSPNFDESEIFHVDVSFTGGEGDRLIIKYDKKIWYLSLNIEYQLIIHKNHNRSFNISRNDRDNSGQSKEFDNSEEKNKMKLFDIRKK